MKPIRLTLFGDVPSKKNSKRVFRHPRTGRTVVLSSKGHDAWHSANISRLIGCSERVDETQVVELSVIMFYATTRRKDLDNALASVQDLLVDAGILPDDDFRHVVRVSAEFGGIDRANPRVDVEIHEYFAKR